MEYAKNVFSTREKEIDGDGFSSQQCQTRFDGSIQTFDLRKPRVPFMSSLVSLLLNPLTPLNPSWDDDDEGRLGLDVVYPLTLCMALGIWLVVARYKKAQYAAIAFDHAPLEVSCCP
jgi:hypothetical protein